MKRFVCKMFFFFFGTSILLAQSGIQTAVNTFVKSDYLKNALVGVAVIDQNTGKVIAGHNPDLALIPASSLKVLTTATMLELFGSDYRFKTEIQYDGTIDEEGVLNGNLYIKGYGDPSLGSHHVEEAEQMAVVIEKFVAAIKKAGITKVEGKIIGDGSYFSSIPNGRTWSWEDIGNYYGAGVWGLNLRENLFHLTFAQKSTIGLAPDIKSVEPIVPNLLLVNELQSADRGTGDNAYIFNIPYSYTAFIRGTIPIGGGVFTIKGAIPDGPFFAAYTLMKALEEEKVETSGWASSQFEQKRLNTTQGDRQTIYSYQSPRLKSLIQETNLKSINLYCEVFLRMIGLQQRGEGSADAGIEAMYDYWENKGLNMDFLFLKDGSGLSPRNGISAAQLANILRLIKENHKTYNDFYSSLSIAGKSGGLKYLLKGTNAEGNLRAKSGGMERVRSYTGYTKTRSGQSLTFCMIANNFKGKSRVVRSGMEQLMAALSK